MDRSAQTLSDPASRPPQDRRRSVRQRLHSPVYASFNGPGTGMVVDLSELIDLNEEGFAVQTAGKLEVNRAVTLCLELPETKSYVHGSGQVIWSDDAGRCGIRFAALTDVSKRIIKEWLLANLLIGSSNHAARTEQLARREEPLQPAAAGPSKPEVVPPAEPLAMTEPTAETVLARMQQEFDALSALDSISEELRTLGTDADVVFAFITDRALHLTGASGAALAFQTGGSMVCRGRAGEIAPPLAAPVDARRGLTGECVTSGSLVFCGDMGNDPRVDPEIGRALGIGSLLAAPIKLESRVVGLLELFFSQPRHFSDVQKTILLRLVDLIPKSCLGDNDVVEVENYKEKKVEQSKTIKKAAVHTNKNEFLPPEQVSPVVAPALPQPTSREHLVLERLSTNHAGARIPRLVSGKSPFFFRAIIALTVVVVAVVIGYLVGPLVEKRMGGQPKDSQRFLNSAEASVPALTETKQVRSLSDLRKLADSGDADAQWQLGVRYHNGEQVPHDDTRAMLWFLRAAEQGQVTAQATLGAYYWAGRGVPQDLTKAYFWSALAFAQGDENSRSRLEGLASQMTKTQVGTARQQAEIWLRSHNAQAKSTGN